MSASPADKVSPPLPTLRIKSTTSQPNNTKQPCSLSASVSVSDLGTSSKSSDIAFSPESQGAITRLNDQYPNLSVTFVRNEDPPPSTPPSPQSQTVENTSISTLAEMFPLLPISDIQIALLQCEGSLFAAIDLLLVKDLVDSEMNEQDPNTSSRPLCKQWVDGQCIGARAAACRARHFYNDQDCWSKDGVIEKGSRNRGTKLRVFSSPYKARVVTEQVKVFTERVNLETGKEDKLLEVQEREFIDLTGEVIEDLIELQSDNINNNLVNKGDDNELDEKV